MIIRSTGAVAFVFGSLLAVVPSKDADATALGRTQASVRGQQQSQARAQVQNRAQRVRPQQQQATRNNSYRRQGNNVRRTAYNYGGGRLQCVPFARSMSGIEIRGNAHTWWDQASGVYQRGRRPELGSVLSFRSTGSMRLGHVAVVTSIVNAREIRIDHANWSRGAVTRGMRVIDVSPDNSWTSVQVGSYGPEGTPGRQVYPINGFIYPRGERGFSYASAEGAQTRGNAPAPAASRTAAAAPQAAPAQQGGAAPWVFRYEELAEATRNGVDLTRGR